MKTTISLAAALSVALPLFAQSPEGQPPPPGPRGGMGQRKMELVKQFDKDGDRRLNAAERKAAREFLKNERAAGRGPRAFGGPGGGGGPAPGAMLAPQVLSQADRDGDRKVSPEEFSGLADAWFDKLDPDRAGKLNQEQLVERAARLVPPPEGQERPQGGRAAFGPGRSLGEGLLAAGDADKDGSLTRGELKTAFARWSSGWDGDKSGALSEEELRAGLDSALPRANVFRAGGPGFRSRGENREPPRPGPRLTPYDVKSFPDALLYDLLTLRTLFLEFEDADWEKELAEFKNTDVEVPASLTVDGKTYRDVGVHFRGMSSFMGVGEGWKRSLNLSLDFVHRDQQLGGYRTLNLLNSHEDPTFLRLVLFNQIAREYLPAPRANFMRVVINGESWGLYVNAQQFNKEFVKEWFKTEKGARWKVPGSPGGRGSLAYLGEDVDQYRRIYEIKSKDDPKAWADLIRLCKVLNETHASGLEAALAPILDIDGALRFLALDNALINNDGYWIRTSDYSIYQDPEGKFHVLPNDANETFSIPGGPGFGGGRGRGAGPAMAAPQILSQADRDGDSRISREELTALADAWFDRLDPAQAGKVSREQFTANLRGVLPPPQGGGPAGGGPPGGGPAGGGPGGRRAEQNPELLAPLFTTADADGDGSLTRAELKGTFARWHGEWDVRKSGSLSEEALRNGLTAAFPPPGPGGSGGGRGPGGAGGPPGREGGARINGVELDPLHAASDPTRPLISKLLAVPSLRARYLAYTRDIAEKHLDWNTLGPTARQYHSLIAADVELDTRKLDSTEDFQKGLTESLRGGGFGRGTISLKEFAEQRRAYLLGYRAKRTMRF